MVLVRCKCNRSHEWICTATRFFRFFTRPVGSFLSNSFGLNSIIGDVYEGIADCYHASYVMAPTDGSASTEDNCTQHMLRGGGYSSTTLLARSAHKGGPAKADSVRALRGCWFFAICCKTPPQRVCNDTSGQPPGYTFVTKTEIPCLT